MNKTTYSLKSKDDGILYRDPFTSKTAIFEDKKTALITSFMLFDQQGLKLEVIEN